MKKKSITEDSKVFSGVTTGIQFSQEKIKPDGNLEYVKNLMSVANGDISDRDILPVCIRTKEVEPIVSAHIIQKQVEILQTEDEEDLPLFEVL